MTLRTSLAEMLQLFKGNNAAGLPQVFAAQQDVCQLTTKESHELDRSHEMRSPPFWAGAVAFPRFGRHASRLGDLYAWRQTLFPEVSDAKSDFVQHASDSAIITPVLCSANETVGSWSFCEILQSEQGPIIKVGNVGLLLRVFFCSIRKGNDRKTWPQTRKLRWIKWKRAKSSQMTPNRRRTWVGFWCKKSIYF